jgi:hypothetical protein
MFWRSILGPSSQGRWRENVLTKKSLPPSQITRSHNPKHYFWIFSMDYITVYYKPKKWHVVGNKCTLLFYIIFWIKQKYVREYVILSNKIYRPISVCCWFVINLNFAVFLVPMWIVTGEGWVWCSRRLFYRCRVT